MARYATALRQAGATATDVVVHRWAAEIARRYREPQRNYHTTAHVDRLLALMGAQASNVRVHDVPTVTLAILFHEYGRAQLPAGRELGQLAHRRKICTGCRGSSMRPALSMTQRGTTTRPRARRCCMTSRPSWASQLPPPTPRPRSLRRPPSTSGQMTRRRGRHRGRPTSTPFWTTTSKC